MSGVLYAGPLTPGTTCHARYEALRQIEPEVHAFDIDIHFSKLSRIGRMVELAILKGPAHRRINREFLELFHRVRPEIVWMDKSYWTFSDTISEMRKAGAYLVQYNTDALLAASRKVRLVYRQLRQTLGMYDLYFTTNLPDYERLSKQGSPITLKTDLGFDHGRFNGSSIDEATHKDNASELLFIGHHEASTESGIVALVDAGLPITVYGENWHRARNRKKLEQVVRSGRISNEEYVRRLKCAKIGLCFVSTTNFNQTAGRSFEIPACGTFLLAMRTPAHQKCYREGEEAEFFDGPEELVVKARRYIADDIRRKEIAIKGHERCIRSGWSWADLMKRDWAEVRRRLTSSRPQAAIAL